MYMKIFICTEEYNLYHSLSSIETNLILSARIVVTLIDINTFSILVLVAISTHAITSFVLYKGIQTVADVAS